MYNFYNLPNYKVLTEDETKDYFKEISQNNKEARNFIIQNNLRLVIKVAKSFESTGIELEELVSIGSIGLIKAVDSYNVNRNIKFVTFAARCIGNEILMYLRKSKKEINTISLETEFFNTKTSEPFNLNDLLQDENADVEKSYNDYETNLVIYEILETLDEREQQIIKMLFGFEIEKPYNQKEIAKILGLSPSYVSRIIKKALHKIKTNSKSKKLILTLYN